MNDIIKIVESLGDSVLLTDNATETVQHEIKQEEEGRFIGTIMAPVPVSLIKPMASSLIQPVVSSLINGDMRAGKGQKGGIFFY